MLNESLYAGFSEGLNNGFIVLILIVCSIITTMLFTKITTIIVSLISNINIKIADFFSNHTIDKG